jgi:hypothetical protein
VVTAIEYGIRITGNLKVGGDSLHIGGRQLLRYDADKATATINASHIDFLDATVHSKGAWIIGDEDTGISISPTRLAVGGRMSIIVATPIRTRWIGRCGTAW